MPQKRIKKTKLAFSNLLTKFGLSENATSELWKWYDPTGKKGAASF
jgi:hypothetical protein